MPVANPANDVPLILPTVAVNVPVPLPVTSPVKVIVWFPVFVPLKFAAVIFPEKFAVVPVKVPVKVSPANVGEAVVVTVCPTDTIFDEIVTPEPAVNAACFELKVDQSVLLKYPFTLEVAAGIDIIFVDLVSGDEKVNGASKSVPATAALTTPDPLAFINPLTVPAPPTLLPITDPLHVPVVIVPTVFKADRDVNVEFDVAVIFPAVVAVLALPVKFPMILLLNVFAPAIV